jgi:hypothetical protein
MKFLPRRRAVGRFLLQTRPIYCLDSHPRRARHRTENLLPSDPRPEETTHLLQTLTFDADEQDGGLSYGPSRKAAPRAAL